MSGKVVNTYHLGYADLDETGVSLLAVLVQKDYGGFKVYSGLVALPNSNADEYAEARINAAQRIMYRGTQERYERAVTFFPSLKREQYSA